MDTNILIPIICILVLAIFNVPIWIALLGGILPYFLFLEPSLPAKIIMQRVLAPGENASYLAIPFFVLAGCIMNYAGMSRKLLNLADGLVGHLPGGLGHINVVLSVLMGGISGSSAADAAMECKILVPEMTRHGYDKAFSAAVTLGSSMLTPIIPPGIGLIMFAFVTEVSVGRMLAGGYIPGFLGMVFMMIYVAYVSKKKSYGSTRDHMATPKELGKLILDGIWALLMPFGIILALRLGVFTATEAGAMCAIYALIVGVFIHKEIKLKHIWPILKESVLGTATVMILICAANALSYFLTYEQIPQKLSETILSMNPSRYTFLLMVNVLLLIIGMLMDGGIAIVILGPLLMPIARSLGIDPIHFGLLFVFNTGIGNMTPPFGIVLYQVAGLLQIDMHSLIKASIPFIGILLLVLLLITLIPELVLFIPNLIYG